MTHRSAISGCYTCGRDEKITDRMSGHRFCSQACIDEYNEHRAAARRQADEFAAKRTASAQTPAPSRVRSKNAKIGRAAVVAGLPKPRDAVRIKYDRDPLRARGVAMEPAKEISGYMDGTQLVTNDHRETPWAEHKREGNVIMLHTYRAGAVDGWMVGVVSGRAAAFKGRAYATAALAKIAFRKAIKVQESTTKLAMGRMVK